MLSRPMLSDFQSSRKSVAAASRSCRSPQRGNAAGRWTFLFAVAQTKTVLDGVRRKGLGKDESVVVCPSWKTAWKVTRSYQKEVLENDAAPCENPDIREGRISTCHSPPSPRALPIKQQASTFSSVAGTVAVNSGGDDGEPRCGVVPSKRQQKGVALRLAPEVNGSFSYGSATTKKLRIL